MNLIFPTWLSEDGENSHSCVSKTDKQKKSGRQVLPSYGLKTGVWMHIKLLLATVLLSLRHQKTHVWEPKNCLLILLTVTDRFVREIWKTDK